MKSNTDNNQAADEVAKEEVVTPNLDVQIVATFPKAEVFGVKLVNGKPTEAVLDITNNEAEPITVSIVGGALSSLQELPAGALPYTAIVRNLTSSKVGVEIPAGAQESVPYKFTLDMHPKDLKLQLVAVVTDSNGAVYQVQAYNEKVSVVEPPVSFFNPQM